MKVSHLQVENFRGVQKANLLFPDHAVLIGDNNTGKSTVLEALDLVLGPDRLSRSSPVDEHDFYLGRYRSEHTQADESDGAEQPQIRVEAIVTGLTDEQRNHFNSYIEWWDEAKNQLYLAADPSGLDEAPTVPALRVTFIGKYDPEEDDFEGKTYFTSSLEGAGDPEIFGKRDKQLCGFLYLRSIRTGTRALSLQRGSLLDIILRLKEIRPKMWEATLTGLSQFEVGSDPALGISGVLGSIDAALKKYVPREWGIQPHLRVSALTRQHLREVITAFIATGEGEHAAPYYRQGAGTINMLLLAMLSQIAEEKQNVIFAMEEPETAIPPYAQKRIVHELRKLSAQSILTSHSPYVLEEFALDETMVLNRSAAGELSRFPIILPASVKQKRYRQEFRTRFCEALLSRRVLIAEGATEATSLPAAARRLSELNPARYLSLEALGVSIVDAAGNRQIADLTTLYKQLGKQTFVLCDKVDVAQQKVIGQMADLLFMHDYDGFEQLVLKNTTKNALNRFADALEWPPHLATRYRGPNTDIADALFDYFQWSKGNWGVAEFLAQCSEDEIPEWLRNVCGTLKVTCSTATTT